jgi:uncharacterized protein (TIGR02453 family)
MNEFNGFQPQSFEFFRELANNNNKPWFDAHREVYEQHVAGAFRRLLIELEPSLLELNPHFETAGKTNGNFSRINRDIRFSKDKSPYKSNYYLRVFDARRGPKIDGCLYVGLSADCVTAGFCTYGTWGRGPKSALDTVFRPRFSKEQALFERLLTATVRRRRYETYWYRQEKRDWKQRLGLPRREEDWQTLQGWVVRKVYEAGAKGLDSRQFAGKIEKLFRDLYPLYVFTSQADSQWRRALSQA